MGWGCVAHFSSRISNSSQRLAFINKSLERVANSKEIGGSTCHGPDGKGLPTKVAPPLIVPNDFGRLFGAKHTMIDIVLHGLKGPVRGNTYAIEMPAMASNNDQWVASVLSYRRYDLGLNNRFPGPIPPQFLARVLVSPDEVKKVRDANAARNGPWTMEELRKK